MGTSYTISKIYTRNKLFSSNKTFADPDVLAWVQAVISNGGDYNDLDIRAVDYFITECKQAGLWLLLDRVNIFAGRNLTAARVPLKIGSGVNIDANFNFVEADYVANSGLTGTNPKYLNPGLNNTWGSQISKTIGVLPITNGSGLIHIFSGNTNNGSTGMFKTTAPVFGFRINSVNTVTIGAPSAGNPFIATRNSPDSVSYISGTGSGSLSLASEAPATEPIYVFRSTSGNYFNGTLSGYLCGLGMSLSQITLLYTIWRRTAAILGRV